MGLELLEAEAEPEAGEGEGEDETVCLTCHCSNWELAFCGRDLSNVEFADDEFDNSKDCPACVVILEAGLNCSCGCSLCLLK